MSSHKTRSSATTTTVPLNDYSDLNNTPKSPGRGKKSTSKRRPTPKPQRSRKRVLESVENEASNRLPSPKRLKQNGALDSDYHERASLENKEIAIVQLDDLVEAALVGDTDRQLSSVEGNENEAFTEEVTLMTSTIQNPTRQAQSVRSQRATSPFKFRRQGQESSVAQTAPSLSNNIKNPRRLLISDFAEPRQFDSVMEGEDFSMVSLSSLPSAQQHLSSRKDNFDTGPANARTRTRNVQQRQSELRSYTNSPNAVSMSGALRSRRSPQYLNNTATADNVTKLPSPAESPPLSPKYPELPNVNGSPAKSRESSEQSGPDGISDKNLDSEILANDEGLEVGPPSPESDVQDDIGVLEDFGFDEDDDQPGVILPESIDADAADNDSVFSKEQSPYLAQENVGPLHVEEHDPIDDNLLLDGNTRSYQEESANHINAKDVSSRIPESRLDELVETKNKSYLEQSSMLQLPQDRDTPSKVFSSPTLPNMLAQQNKVSDKHSSKKVATPRLKRVVKAGKALQDAVQPVIEQQLSMTPRAGTIERHRDQEDDLFSGFSMSTRRELRAGLRLGNELAKRHSSLLDITMHTVSTQDDVDVPHRTDASVSQRETLESHKANSTTEGALPELFTEENIQLLSPEVSSNATDNKIESLSKHRNSSHNHENAASVDADVPFQDISNDIAEDDFLQAADGKDFEDQGFASESETEAHAAHEETDIWQLAADSTSFLQDSVSQHMSRLPTAKATDLFDVGVNNPHPLPEAIIDEEEDTETILHHSIIDNFDQESTRRSPRIKPPTALSDMLTPSDTDSSPQMNTRRNQVEFTDFTGFTKDLLQAAANRDRRQRLHDRISEEREVQAPPSAIKLPVNRTYQTDVFLTKSFLDTSPASVKSKRFSPRKPISFRPTNRKESWLLDPSRLRKPPSPLKQVRPFLPSPIVESDTSDQLSSKDHDEAPQDIRTSQAVNSDLESSDHGPDDEQQQVFSSSSSLSSSQSVRISNHRSLPVPRAPTAQNRQDKQSPVIHIPTHQSESPRISQVKNSPAKRLAPIPSIQKPSHDTKANPGNLATRSSPITQISELNSHQSSFVSNASSNASYASNDTQSTWLSFLTTVTTPLITSTKTITNLATTAFWNSRQETFYPDRKATSLVPAVLTTHMPFNDAHWSALQMLYTAALEEPHKFPLDFTHPCADFLGLEIESLGWRRALNEWELAVVVKFLQLLEEEGKVEDDEQESMMDEEIIKRVFSLWVGMVTRGELELTDGTAGAWDRRFVGRRDAVLQKQTEWLKAHR